MTSIIIIGAGLSGLLTATKLLSAGHNPIILEARKRSGGRILSIPPKLSDPTASNFRFDLGPTWVWPHQQHILQLLRDLDLKIYPQYDSGAAVYEQNSNTAPRAFRPEWQQPASYRVVGGITAAIEALAAKLPESTIRLNQTVLSISASADGIAVLSSGKTLQADHVIVTLPPHLAATTIKYEPALSAELHRVMTTTPTWMGLAMKVVLQYDKPFWRERGLSGLGISHAGPVAQYHDASPHDGTVGALFGWIGDNHPSRQLPHAERKAAVVAQTVRMFGEAASQPRLYDELNWAQETTTTNLENNPVATEHPTYGHPLLQTPQLDGRLHWAVTEASPIEGGYLDGCVVIAEQVANRIIAADEA